MLTPARATALPPSCPCVSGHTHSLSSVRCAPVCILCVVSQSRCTCVYGGYCPVCDVNPAHFDGPVRLVSVLLAVLGDKWPATVSSAGCGLPPCSAMLLHSSQHTHPPLLPPHPSPHTATTNSPGSLQVTTGPRQGSQRRSHLKDGIHPTPQHRTCSMSRPIINGLTPRLSRALAPPVQ